MRTIEPLNWTALDDQVTSLPMQDAVRIILLAIVNKVNEIIEVQNERD